MIQLTDRQHWTLLLARGRAKLIEAYVGVSDESLRALTDEGGWTLGDIFAHVAIWEARVARLLPDILASDTPMIPAVADGALEQRAFADIRARGFEAVLADASRDRAALLVALAGAPDDAIARARHLPSGQPFTVRQWAIQELADHDAEHAIHARAARKARGVKFAIGPKAVLAEAFATAHAYLSACAACVPAGEEATLPVTGDWTLKDALGHLADWHETIASAADGARSGQPLTRVEFGRIQEYNDAHAAARQADSWAKVSADYAGSWAHVQAALNAAEQADFTREAAANERGPISLYSWLNIASEHELEHAEFLFEGFVMG
ncbi:MAG: DinB family protein [Chloroflexi bacterium]|nr:DinB family protein [Chloroflexota bacterium]